MNLKKKIILMPVYNDWASLNKLLKNINSQARKMYTKFNIFIVNDNSTKKIKIISKNLSQINNIEVLNLSKNMGNQIAIGVGLKYLRRKKNISEIIVMDSDGEDSPFKLNKILDILKKNKECFVFASRLKRNENFFLRFLNNIRLIFTLFLTGKYIDYGNFSCFNSKNLKKITDKKENFLAYCSHATNLFNIIKVPIKKDLRYLGNSKANFRFLLGHSLNIISIFYFRVILLSFLYLLIFFVFAFYEIINMNIFLIFLILILFFNFNIFNRIISQRDMLYYNKYIIDIIKIK